MKIDPVPFADFPVVVAFTFNGPTSEVSKIADYIGGILTAGLRDELNISSAFLELKAAQDKASLTRYQIAVAFVGAIL